MKKMRAIETIMQEGGYVTVARAGEAIGAGHVSTVHKHIQAGRLRGARAGQHWFVSVWSLLQYYTKDVNPVLHKRILGMGVEPVEELSPAAENEERANPGAKRKIVLVCSMCNAPWESKHDCRRSVA